MKIDGIGSRFLLEKLNRTDKNSKDTQPEFADSFSRSLLEESQEELGKAAEAEKSLGVENPAVRTTASTAVLNSRRINLPSSVECEVRHITSAQSDYVKADVQAGYTLKAQVDVLQHSVYVEAKGEDGTIRAYEVNSQAVDRQTEDAIEQMALEAWERPLRSCVRDRMMYADTSSDEEAMALEQALDSFYNYAGQKLGLKNQEIDEITELNQTEEHLSGEMPTQEQIRRILEEN